MVTRRATTRIGFFGFMHATGHGLGLEVHEAPSLGSGKDALRVGDVITIEPGLYYPEMGGIRIEDTVTVTRIGWRYLVPCEKNFEIPVSFHYFEVVWIRRMSAPR
jgi:Xaa-Pro aminopeptidase